MSKDTATPAFDADGLFPETTAKAPSPRDLCARSFENLQPGQLVAVGGKAWKVDQAHGLTKYLTRAGAKGRKLYRLHVASVEPCCVQVREVHGGSGEFKDGTPAAAGCRVEDGVFMGGTRKRQPTSKITGTK